MKRFRIRKSAHNMIDPELTKKIGCGNQSTNSQEDVGKNDILVKLTFRLRKPYFKKMNEERNKKENVQENHRGRDFGLV